MIMDIGNMSKKYFVRNSLNTQSNGMTFSQILDILVLNWVYW